MQVGQRRLLLAKYRVDVHPNRRLTGVDRPIPKRPAIDQTGIELGVLLLRLVPFLVSRATIALRSR
jgi:hypothetical protein